MYCKKCGNEIPEGSKFCCHCGTSVNESTTPKEVSPTSVNKVSRFSFKRHRKAIIAILVVLLSVVGGVYIYNNTGLDTSKSEYYAQAASRTTPKIVACFKATDEDLSPELAKRNYFILKVVVAENQYFLYEQEVKNGHECRTKVFDMSSYKDEYDKKYWFSTGYRAPIRPMHSGYRFYEFGGWNCNVEHANYGRYNIVKLKIQ